MAALIRFDWAVKKLLRNKANFGILEGFLSELFGFDVKVEQILESESNKDDEKDKFNRVDILVRTDENELILVEVQNDPETDYFHRILYGVSKLATEYLKEGEGYGTIKKIISVNILYFQLGVGNDYVYEYQGEFIGKHLKDTLHPNYYQKNKYKIKKISDILPKYYLLKINNFNNVAQDSLDEWIYFLKNSEVPKSFKAKGIQEAAEKLRIDSLTKEERKIYQRYQEARWIEKDVIETAENKGMEKGIEKGMEKGMETIVLHLHSLEKSEEEIAFLTTLAIEKVIEIIKNNEKKNI